VVIDPRRTETAAVADAHHAIRPGADVFLLAAMVNTLFANGWVRLGAVAEWVKGVDEVRQAVAAFTPEVVGELPMSCLAEEIETAGADQIRALITVATNPVLSVPNGPRIAKALASLDFMVSMDIYLNETTRHADVILPGASPLQDDHFDVTFAQLSWRNHACYSVLVLPPEERPAEWQILLKLTAIVQGQTADVDVNALDDVQFAQDVQRQLGNQAAAVLQATQNLCGPQRLFDLVLRTGPYGDAFGQRPDGLTLAKVQAAPSGIDLGELQPRVPEMLRTPSGKIELAPPMLLADLPRAWADVHTLAPELVIIGRRDVRSNNSWMHNLPLLAKGSMRCTVLVNPTDAARLQLQDGKMACINSTAGQVQAQVEVSADMMPGVVSLPHR